MTKASEVETDNPLRLGESDGVGLLDTDFPDDTAASLDNLRNVDKQPRQPATSNEESGELETVEISQNDLSVLNELFDLGKDGQLKDLLEEVKHIREGRLANEASLEFIQDHKEYTPTPQNAMEFQQFLMDNQLPWTRENLELAFEELKRANRLQLQAAPRLRPQRTVSSTGLSPRQSAGDVGERELSNEDFKDEIAGLSLEQARDLTLRRMAEARKRQGTQEPYYPDRPVPMITHPGLPRGGR